MGGALWGSSKGHCPGGGSHENVRKRGFQTLICTKQAPPDPFGCWPPKTERPGQKCSPVGVIWSKSENGGSSKVAERKVPKGWKLSRSRLTTRYRSLIAMRSFAVLQDLLIVHLFAKFHLVQRAP